MGDGSQRTMPGWRRTTRGAVRLVVGLYLGYLLAANVVLVPSIGQTLVNRKPDKARLSWTGGWSLWPGRLHLTDLAIKAQSRRLRWQLDVGRVSGSVALVPLLAKELRLDGARGARCRFLLTRRALADDGLDREGLPEISGLPDGPPGPRREKRHRWRIVVTGATLEEIEELWIFHQRYLGSGRAEGGFDLELRGPASIPGARLELDGGAVRVAESTETDLERLVLELAMTPVGPDERNRADLLRSLSGRLAVEASRTDLAALGSFFRGAPWIDLEGDGSLSAEIFLDDGRLADRTRVDAEADAAVTYLETTLTGSARLTGRVREEAGREPTATLELDFDAYRLADAAAAEPHVTGSGATVRAVTSSLDLADPEPDLDAVIEIPASQVPRLAHYNRFLPPGSGLVIVDGSGTLSGRMHLTTDGGGRLDGEVSLDGKALEMLHEGLSIRGDLAIAVDIPEGSITDRRLSIAGSRIEVRNARLSAGRDLPRAEWWWADVDVPDGEVTLAQPLALEARVGLRVRDTSPLLALVAKSRGKPRWLRELLAVERVAGTGGLRFDEAGVWIDDLALAAGEHLELLAHLRLEKPTVRGLLFARYRKLSAAVEIDAAGRDWDLVRSRRWYERKAAAWPGDGR